MTLESDYNNGEGFSIKDILREIDSLSRSKSLDVEMAGRYFGKLESRIEELERSIVKLSELYYSK